MLRVHAFESRLYSFRALLRLMGLKCSLTAELEGCMIILNMTTGADDELLYQTTGGVITDV